MYGRSCNHPQSHQPVPFAEGSMVWLPCTLQAPNDAEILVLRYENAVLPARPAGSATNGPALARGIVTADPRRPRAEVISHHQPEAAWRPGLLGYFPAVRPDAPSPIS
jgi:hypothetical protein